MRDRVAQAAVKLHHRRVPPLLRPGTAAVSLRWPSRTACQRFRDRFRALLKQQGQLRHGSEWVQVRRRVNAYLRSFGQYFRNGQGTSVLNKLDRFVQERLARYLARC